MSRAATAPQKITRLNPRQQWRYFSEPLVMGDWMREHYGDFVPVGFQDRQFIAVMTAEGARQVFSQDPDGYDAFWKESFAGLMGQESVWVLIQGKHRRERQ